MNPSVQPKKVWRNVAIIAYIVLAEPLASTSLLPFVYFMVRDFGYEDHQVGLRAGIITSAFFVAQMIATPGWCLLSNRLGRRPVLITGLLGSGLSLILFGRSQSFIEAAITRSLGGLLNGNLPICRTYIGELATQTQSDLSKLFSVFGFALSMGFMVGPLLGGAFADPANNLGFAGPVDIFAAYPWLLPCLLSAAVNLGACFAAYFALDETHTFDTPSTEEHSPNEVDSLLPQNSVTDSNILSKSTSESRWKQAAALLSSACFFTHVILFDELFSVYAASSLSKGTGLSFQPRQIASVLTIAGPSMGLALLLFPRLQRQIRLPIIYQITSVIFVLIYPLFSLLPGLANRDDSTAEAGSVLWTTLLTLVSVRYAVLAVSLTSLQIICNSLVPPQELALFNGLGQSVGSLSRAVGPSLGGATWSWSLSNGLSAPFDYHASFWLLALLGLGQGMATISLFKRERLVE
ncbi:hypothetical protein UA08_01302 [Talaromyces atroroseus]|uniref:Major facilitator superfamily (MFS) profile domain-containing protein n=1 Tax=Talaromyces atroroseus TaxID=1441469 RepID=A0A1Q5Q9Y3_TALAT|nr:hypothetical protein UA08_01302 [Talaromyces atroroseus]OKL62753.1 hypothetical protein UA08_01302 [Talaromyces atroroseus]